MKTWCYFTGLSTLMYAKLPQSQWFWFRLKAYFILIGRLSGYSTKFHDVNKWDRTMFMLVSRIVLCELRLLGYQLLRVSAIADPKGKHQLVGWCESGDHLLASGGGFRRLMPASDLPTRTTRRAGVFLLYCTYLWNKQQVM